MNIYIKYTFRRKYDNTGTYLKSEEEEKSLQNQLHEATVVLS